MRNYREQIEADQRLAEKYKQDALKNIRIGKTLTAINLTLLATNVALFCVRIFVLKG